MSMITRGLICKIPNGESTLLQACKGNIVPVRNAAKKIGATARNHGGNSRRPKHRTWKFVDGHYVHAGSSLVTQLTPRFHPGLYVGFGINATLYAMESGKVAVTCEKVNLNWDHTWVQRCYAGNENQTVYKKHYNIIPDKQHDRFKLVDTI